MIGRPFGQRACRKIRARALTIGDDYVEEYDYAPTQIRAGMVFEGQLDLESGDIVVEINDNLCLIHPDFCAHLDGGSWEITHVG